MLVVFDTTVLVSALRSPFGPAFRLLRLVQGLPIADGHITDITGWEFVRIASGHGHESSDIEDFLDAFDPLFEHDNVSQAPISRRLLGSVLDNVSLEDAVLHLTGRRLADFTAEVPPAIVTANESRDPYDLHLVWAVINFDADVLCTTDRGFRPEIGEATVCSPVELLQLLEAD